MQQPSISHAGLDDLPLTPLWEDGERRFCRAEWSTADGVIRRCIAIVPIGEQHRLQAPGRFANELSIGERLDADWALRPLETRQQRGQDLLLVDDWTGRPLGRLDPGPWPVERFLPFAAQLARTLARMHAAGIVHKDIKAGNVLVDEETGRCKLTGFGVATRLLRERQPPAPPEFLAGTLSHMAPEQTGRMNRSVDSRSDLYALGVTLYELLTGELPFAAAEPMEWVHCHVARRPEPPAARIAGIPPQVSAIVMKLLAKTPEERYQTAAGLERDLQRCVVALTARGMVTPFGLGTDDRPDRLRIPERLHGRESAIETLAAAFEQVVVEERASLVLVRGPAGIGKSSVVNELHKVLVPPRGLFVSGKFSQLQRDVPYAPLAEAFRGVLRQVLGLPDDELAHWRSGFEAALEGNGAIVLDLVPELRHVIGPQPAVPELAPPAAKARIQRALRRFIGVFARPEHPLALFLDDLQWLDAATLELVQDLMVQPEVQHLLVVGAYRDDEVGPGHALVRWLDTMHDTGSEVREIALLPLREDDLARLIADALHSDATRVGSLARLVHGKTGGNPFFAGQFLHALADEGALSFDAGAAQWHWDSTAIEAKRHTENVAALMAGRLRRLPASTRDVLMRLACLGSHASLATLAIACAISPDQLESDLWEARQQELVAGNDPIRFSHDRIQEAAYLLLPEERRASEHLRIGRLLLAALDERARGEALFDLVAQFDRGSALIESREEKEAVAELELAAGGRARSAAAYATAARYMAAGVALLDTSTWDRRHALCFALEMGLAEGEFLSGDVMAANARLERLASRAEGDVERCSVVAMRADVQFALQRPDLALGLCLDCLGRFGVALPGQPTPELMREACEAVWARLTDRTVDELVELPLMSDPASRAALEVLFRAILCSTLMDRNLAGILVCAAIELSLDRGNADGSCFAYAYLGWMTGWQYGRPDGYRFGRVAMGLMERKGLKRLQAIVQLTCATQIVSWSAPIAEARELIRSSFALALASGDRLSAVSAHCLLVTHQLVAGEPLDSAAHEAAVGLGIAREAQAGDFVVLAAALGGLARSLQGQARRPGSLDSDDLDEAAVERHYAEAPHLPALECWYLVRKLQARFFAGEFAAALEAGQRAQALLWSTPALLEVAECEFFTALAHAGACADKPNEAKAGHAQAATRSLERLEAWARDCPSTFENRALLVAAELARVEQREPEAMRLYDRAIASARTHGLVHNEALANELAGAFYEARGFDRIARAYLEDARAGYRRWGAHGKVRELEGRRALAGVEDAAISLAGTVFTPVARLDLGTVTQVLQAVSGEIDLQALATTIMRAALAHAGAERALLIVPQPDGPPRIEAEARTDGDAVRIEVEPADITPESLPGAALQYVLRTREHVLLADAKADPAWAGDDYVRLRRTRSMLCLPLLKQARLVGVLYLENQLAAGIFTPARMDLLRLLASEAAIALENAQLYRDVQEREARMRRLVDANIVGIVLWHRDGRILEANDAFLRLVGQSRDEVASGRMPWPDLTRSDGAAADARAFAMPSEHDTLQAVECQLLRGDGGHVPVLVGVARFDATPDEGVGFFLDLTERKQAENAYHELQARLADANRIASVGHLAAAIAHELNQPLAGIMNNASTGMRMLAAEPADVTGAGETARRTIRDAQRASEVIRRLRDLFARKAPELESIELNDLVREVLALYELDLRRGDVQVVLELATNLPSARVDRVQLQQVILNLLRNAADAMRGVEDRPRRLTLRTTLVEGDLVRLDVEDSGVGIAPEVREQLFDPFFTTKADGMGIGLSVSRSIMERHGGRLWVTEGQGPGACFALTLPATTGGGPD